MTIAKLVRAHPFATPYVLVCVFVVVLLGVQKLGLPIPLGGTSNHLRVAALLHAGGWDAFNVTEDADLGKIAKALAPLMRAQIAQKRFATEVRAGLAEADRKVAEAAGARRGRGHPARSWGAGRPDSARAGSSA